MDKIIIPETKNFVKIREISPDIVQDTAKRTQIKLTKMNENEPEEFTQTFGLLIKEKEIRIVPDIILQKSHVFTDD